jgi:hypothetical protein
MKIIRCLEHIAALWVPPMNKQDYLKIKLVFMLILKIIL